MKKKNRNFEDDILNDLLLDVPDTPVVLTEKPVKPERIEKPVRSPSPINPIDVTDFPETDIIIPESTDVSIRKFYWFDCCEVHGSVYVFGRMAVERRFVSCCTIVKNVRRTIYLQIGPNSNYEQVEQEFAHIIAKKFKITNFTCQKVTKKNPFAADSPLIADYVKVEYPYTQNPLPPHLKGETFTQIFNYNQSPMEKLILELKLRGPCWLKLIDPVESTAQLTWSKVEFILENPDNLKVDDDPPPSKPYFCTLALSLRTYPNPITHQNEIIAVCCMLNKSFNLDECLKRTNKASGHFMIMTRPSASHKELRLPFDFNTAIKSYSRTRLEIVDSERDLLTTFMDKFIELDPDIVVGHDLLNFDYETLVLRMKANKYGMWSKLGRFKRTELPSTKAAFRYMFSGRVLCDIRSSAMELIHSRSYDLTELVSQVLEKGRIEYNHSSIVAAYRQSQALINMLDATWEDTDSILSILVELNVIPLALKITNITGNILSRTLAAGRSERNEYLLLHAFHDDNFICPEKQFMRSKRAAGDDTLEPTRKKAAYAGGLVLEPNAGYYDTCILLMDFNSLYPSIIQEFNICFSTVQKPDDEEAMASVPEESASPGILPCQLRNLVERRRQVKRLISETKNEGERLMLDIEQKALKLTANSMYGCLGFEQSRFYAKHLASLVTFKGREILMSTKLMVERMGYEVIYGDTDSLMINTKLIDLDEVLRRGTAIKGEINRTFKLLEIDIDGVYRPLLLLKKKNYAGLAITKQPNGSISETTVTKGLDTVRRDRAVIAKEAGEKVLSMILNGKAEVTQIVEDIHSYLKELAAGIRSGAVPKERFLISKQLNRNPEEYRDTKGLGHVAVALRHNQDARKARKMRSGDTVEYVICTDDTGESANQRAYTLEELEEKSDALKLDTEYYLCQQIHPVISRICDKLPVTNAYVLAEMLGIENSSMRREEPVVATTSTSYERPVSITCPSCFSEEQVTGKLDRCKRCNYMYICNQASIVSQVIIMIKDLTLQLYNCKFSCEDCGFVTRNLFGRLDEDLNRICCSCNAAIMRPSITGRQIDLQLCHMRRLFADWPDCVKEIEYALKSSATYNFDAASIFSLVCSSTI